VTLISTPWAAVPLLVRPTYPLPCWVSTRQGVMFRYIGVAVSASRPDELGLHKIGGLLLTVGLVDTRNLRTTRIDPRLVCAAGLGCSGLLHLGPVHGLGRPGCVPFVCGAPLVGLDLSAALGGGRRLLLEALVLCRGLLERLLRLLRGRRGATTAAVLVGEDLGGCDEGPGDGAVDDGVEALCELGR